MRNTKPLEITLRCQGHLILVLEVVFNITYDKINFIIKNFDI